MENGTVVMQNTTSAVFDKTFVGKLIDCFVSDRKQAIVAIGLELKCHIRYHITSTGNLLLCRCLAGLFVSCFWCPRIFFGPVLLSSRGLPAAMLADSVAQGTNTMF
jgi:hypothetical protein